MPGASKVGASPVDIFEELRFVWELYFGILVFLVPLARAKSRAVVRLAGGLAGFSAASLGYFWILDFVISKGGSTQLAVLFWYLTLTFSIVGYLRLCFEVSLPDVLFAGISGYAAQHVVYVVVHELLALWLLPQLTSTLFWLYPLLSVGFSLTWYFFLWKVFSPSLVQAAGDLTGQERWSGVRMSLILAALLGITFGFQHLFHVADANRLYAVWMSVLACCLVLAFQLETLRALLSNREKHMLEQTLRDSAAHWEHSRELIQNLNRSVHDLKHVLRSLESLPAKDREGYVNDTVAYVQSYESRVFSSDEVLNTILSEKALYCENHGISFSCSIGDVDLSFFSAPDLYALLGNVIDNAVEGVEKVDDQRLRAITLAIKVRAGMVMISCDNPYAGHLVMEDGLPATTKADRLSHGFGLRSVRMIAKKYGGSLSVGAHDQIFTVQLAIPQQNVPKAGRNLPES